LGDFGGRIGGKKKEELWKNEKRRVDLNFILSNNLMHVTQRQNKHWKEAILEIIKAHSRDSISLQQIYAEMKNHPLVTEYHLKPWRKGLQPRYQCWIREYLTDLVRKGMIRRVSKGMYSLCRR